ncbi:unnamed protein product, partial [Prorocentrum cordatum]
AQERWTCFLDAFVGPPPAPAQRPSGAAASLVAMLRAVVDTGEGFAVWHHRRDRGLKALVDPVQARLRPVETLGRPTPFAPAALGPQLALTVEPLASVSDLCRHLLRVTPAVEESYLEHCHSIVGSTIHDLRSGEHHEVVDFTV